MTTDTLSQRLPTEFYQRVQHDLRIRLEHAELDAIILEDWRDVAYLTGFFHTPTERPVVVVVTADATTMLVPELEREYARSQAAAVDEVIAYAEYPGVRAPFAVLHAGLSSSTGRWGHAASLPTGMLHQLNGLFDDVNFVISPIVDRMRQVKYAEEIVLHRAAAQLGDVMLAAGRELVEVAVSERTPLPSEAELVKHVVSCGSRWMYDSHTDVVVVPMLTGGLVYSGANSAYPHGLATTHRLRPGETFILSLGGAVGGRYAESERTFVLGEPTAQQRELFELDARAQDVGTAAIGPGTSCASINARCLDVIRDGGHAEHLRHRQGHGIGLNFHEPPWLEDGDDTLLQAGMVVSSEPGVYVPGHGGYRISDTVLVTPDGHERLTTYPRDLDASTIPL